MDTVRSSPFEGAEDAAAYSLLSAEEKIQLLEFELSKVRRALLEEQDQADSLRARLRQVLWDYIPRQRKVQELPPAEGAGSVKVVGDTVVHVAGYRLERALGQGSFGRVVQATVDGDNDDAEEKGRRVAIKVLDLERRLRTSDVLGLELEIRCLKTCLAPNLVRLRRVLRTPRYACLVMDLLPGRSLHALLRGQSGDDSGSFGLSVAVARGLMTGLLRGVAALHSRGFSHRDVSRL